MSLGWGRYFPRTLGSRISPVGEVLHGRDMEPLSGGEGLAVGQLHGSPHSAGQPLVQTSGARRRHQLQPRTDHMTHDCGGKTESREVFPVHVMKTACWYIFYSSLKVTSLYIESKVLTFSQILTS